MQNVKRAVDGGAAFRDAILGGLMTSGLSFAAFAAKHELLREDVSDVVNLKRVPSPKICAALAKQFGGTPTEWAEFWWEQAREASKLALSGP